jgi:hypothetical protein
MTIDQLKYEIIIDFFYFLLTLFTGATRLHNLQFRFVYFSEEQTYKLTFFFPPIFLDILIDYIIV